MNPHKYPRPFRVLISYQKPDLRGVPDPADDTVEEAFFFGSALDALAAAARYLRDGFALPTYHEPGVVESLISASFVPSRFITHIGVDHQETDWGLDGRVWRHDLRKKKGAA